MSKLTEAERQVLEYLSEFDEDFGCFPFAPIVEHTGIERRKVRLACRSLKRKGLTEFYRGLCTEDGGFAGSGYSATPAGRATLREADNA